MRFLAVAPNVDKTQVAAAAFVLRAFGTALKTAYESRMDTKSEPLVISVRIPLVRDNVSVDASSPMSTNAASKAFQGSRHDARQFGNERCRAPTSSSFVSNVTEGQRLLFSTFRFSQCPRHTECLSVYGISAVSYQNCVRYVWVCACHFPWHLGFTRLLFSSRPPWTH